MTTLAPTTSGIVDAHVQYWNPRRNPWTRNPVARGYRYVPKIGDRLFSVAVPQSEREYILTPHIVGRAYEPQHYRADIAAVAEATGVPIESVVVSEAYRRLGDTQDPEAGRHAVDEVRYLQGLAHGAGSGPSLGAMMVRADPRSDGFVERLDAQLAISDRIRGIQVNATRHPDPKVRSAGPADGMLASPSFLAGIEKIADRGLALEVFAYSHQLYDVITLAREFPDTTVIIDHFGCPVGAFGPVGLRTGTTAAARADIIRLWRERMVSIAAERNVVVKLSGLAMPVLGYGREPWGNIGAQETLTQMIGPLVRHVVAHFGASRVMFGSNFPIDKPNATIDTIIGSLLEILEPWGEAVSRNIFRDTARRVYDITEPEPEPTPDPEPEPET
ncbi:amidohydrolase family protein [Gordonia sp. DT30]|uniref:amidohydrolase family protein n=1 Tax=Gordonia sp. DT30 TaxID=3416546 RepID=UPI003CE947F7